MKGLPLVLRNAVAAAVVESLSAHERVARLDALVRALEPAGAVLDHEAATRLIGTRAFIAAEGETPPGPAPMRVVLDPALTAARTAAAQRAARARDAVGEYWRAVDLDGEASAATPLTTALREAAALFAAGLFFEVHEVLEAAWNHLQGVPRSFVQGILQIAVALHHLEHDNATGACSLFAAGRDKIAPLGPEFAGVAVADLLAGMAPWERIAAEGGSWPVDLPLPPLRVQ